MLLSYLISAIFRSRSLEKSPNQLSQTLPSLSLCLSSQQISFHSLCSEFFTSVIEKKAKE